jgi:glycosyltransferase involved in cell wall biosynthesis
MRIAVNTRFLLHNKLEGIGRFTYETLSRITKACPEHEFIFFFDRKCSSEFVFGKNVTPVELFPPTRHPLLILWWFEIAVHAALKKYKADVFLSTDGFLCLRSDVPQVVIIHDLAFKHFPEGINFTERAFYSFFTPRYLKKAAQVVAVSSYTRKDISASYRVPEHRVDIVANAAAAGFRPLAEELKEQTRRKYANGKPYFLYVGAMHPRKNVATLLNAFDSFKSVTSSEMKLVIVGRKAWQTTAIENAYEQMTHKQDVIFTGRVPEEELYVITASALCMVYIPFFEGFGLPIAESIACEIPVITSNTTSMPEVAGEAGLLADPNSPAQVAESMQTIAGDQNLYSRLVDAARMRRQAYNWDTSAQRLWQCIVKASEKKQLYPT